MRRFTPFVRKGPFLLAGYLAVALLFVSLSGELGAQSWRTASRAPAGLAPDPATTREAVVQVYAARTVSWRGYFGVHTWIAVKPTGAARFTVYEVLGFQLRHAGNTGVRTSERAADGYWYGNRPWLLSDVRGQGTDELINRIQAAVADYPYAGTYHIWPGPNSNTFTAHLLRAAPELRVDLPATAVGKDYLGPRLIAKTPSGTGGQVNLFGVAGLLVGWEEGAEINLGGLTFGVNPKRLALKLPLIGNLGLAGSVRPRALAQQVADAGR